MKRIIILLGIILLSTSMLRAEHNVGFEKKVLDFEDTRGSKDCGDINKDTFPDLLGTPVGVDEFKIFWGTNNRDTTFETATLVPLVWLDSLGTRKLADLNNDTWLDIIGCDSQHNKMVVRWNDGTGNFPAGDHTDFTVVSVQYVFVAKLNADDFNDIVVIDTSNHLIKVYLNNGNKTFATPVDYDPPGIGVHQVSGADLDGDTNIDLVAAGDTDILVYFNQGDGTFAAPVTYAVDGATIIGSFTIVDLDNDNGQDIAVINTQTLTDDTIRTFWNNGAGVFNTTTDITYNGFSQSMSGDFDKDGWNDLAVLQSHDPSIYYNDEDKTFTYYRIYPSSNDWPLAYDIDNDSNLDILNAGNQNVEIYYNNGPAPVNSSPVNEGVSISLTPTLEASTLAGFDPNQHKASQWQMTAAASDYSTPLWELTSNTELNNVNVPSGELSNLTAYYWHVRYQKDDDSWSAYSTETYFTTLAVNDPGSSSGGGGGGCFIATAAYGTSMAEEVRTLCKFRDQYLLKCPAGKEFVKFYYATSPPIADFIRNKPALKAMVREALKPLVEYSKEITK